MKILMSGMLAGNPYNGGATWAVLQYVLGFRRLGHEVVVVEPIAEAVEPDCAGVTPSQILGYFSRITQEFSLQNSAALLRVGSRETVGLAYDEIEQFAVDADVLINISGMLRDETLKGRPPIRVFLDLDPAFNQLWASQGVDIGLAGHTHCVTVGQAVGRTHVVPTLGRHWIGTVPPVVLGEWLRANGPTDGALTTIGNWRSYGSIEADGVHYGQKAHSLRRFRALPRLVERSFRIALAIHGDERDDLAMLADNGWELADPREAAGTPADYRAFIQGSWAEFGVAKSGYVASRCGWFSDRSVCYLASGRPVIAQETGFSDFIPTGEGLLPFETVGDVVRAINELETRYEEHANAARELAVTHFDSDRVLTRLLEAVSR